MVLENRLIILMSRVYISDKDIECIKDIFKEKLNWEYIIYQLILHKTILAFLYHLENLGLTSCVLPNIIDFLFLIKKLHTDRLKVFNDEFQKILELTKDLKFVLLKGLYLSNEIYSNKIVRQFNDIDLLIAPDDGKKLVERLIGKGYIQGEFSKQNDTIKPYNSRQIMYHKISSHEFAPCNKFTGSITLPVVQIDLNYSVLWKGNCCLDIDTHELLDRRIPIQNTGETYYSLDVYDQLIQLCIHLYKEATSIVCIRKLKDLQLYKFADIADYIFIKAEEISWEALVGRVKHYSCEKIVYFTLYYVNMLYNILPFDFLEKIKPSNIDYLNEYGMEYSENCKWDESFKERLFNYRRAEKIPTFLLNTNNTYLHAKDFL